MTTEQNKAMVARFNKGFIEGNDMNVFNDTFAPGFVNHTAPAGTPTGPDGVVYFFNHMLRPAFPDLSVEIHDQVAEGSKVTTRKSFHCTHKGDFLGIPASGRKVKIDVIDIIYLDGGKFTDHWGIFDMQNLISQITG